MSSATCCSTAEPGLVLAFARAPSGETWLRRQYASFPWHITRPFRRGGDTLVILQSLGAGLVAGDDFRACIAAGAGTSVRIETQGATVAHTMPHGGARQTVRLEAHRGSRLAWHPRPLVLFPGARVESVLEIVLHDGAEVRWSDAFIPHDAGCPGERFASLASETVVRSPGGRLLAVDRFRITGDVTDDAGVTGRLPVHATCGRAGGAADAPLPGGDAYAGVSTLPGGRGAIIRILARDGHALERTLAPLRG